MGTFESLETARALQSNPEGGCLISQGAGLESFLGFSPADSCSKPRYVEDIGSIHGHGIL